MNAASLARITVYPIKSLDGIDLSRADVLEGGALRHDRQFAFVDNLGRFVNGKRTPAVHLVRAEFDLPAMEAKLCTGMGNEWTTFSLNDDHSALGEWFTEAAGITCRLVENTDGGFPDDRDAPGPTVVSTATLREVAGWFPGLDLEDTRRRFRANLEIDGVEPFWEDRLVGASRQPVEFQIGEVRWWGMKASQRCVVPTRSSRDGEATHGFQKAFAVARERTLPAWAPAEQFDHFYRLAVNTRLAPGQMPGILAEGDAVQLG
jgi:MOSC domain-containing protein